MTDETTTFSRTGRPTVRVVRRYPHPIDKVWRAVTTSEHLGAWFPSPVDIDLRVGGALRFSAFEGEAAATGTVQDVSPPTLLSFTWGGDRLTFELAPDADGTTFTLTHAFDDTAGAASFATGWELCLVGLRHELADRPAPTPDRGTARHEQLVHEFGLDQPEVTTGAEGWVVRYERQLTCPAAVAWDLWFGRDQATGEQRRAPAVGEELTPYMAPDLVIGVMTEVDPPHRMAFDVTAEGGPGDQVCVELADGTGHGARITLTVTGTDPAEVDAARDQWGTGAVDHLARAAAAWAASPERAVTAPSGRA
jgi:uncharacterized protein YndB with AHSA1/START domain